MPTTADCIEENFKLWIAAVAERAGTTPHAFILDAITQTVDQDELSEAFHRVAAERWGTIVATGEAVA